MNYLLGERIDNLLFEKLGPTNRALIKVHQLTDENEALKATMRELYPVILSIQNSRKAHSPGLVYCRMSFDVDIINRLSEKIEKLLELK